MKMKRYWFIIAIVSTLGVTIGIVAANPPEASAASGTTVTVYIDGSQFEFTDVVSHLVDDDGMLRVKLQNDEYIFNEEHWKYVHIETAQ